MSLNKSEDLILFFGVYDTIDDAEADFELVKDLHGADVIGTYDAAVVTKTGEEDAKIVRHTEKPTQHGGWGGLAVGAAIGLIFPPAVIASAITGAAVGGVGGHLVSGIPRGDLKDLGNMLDEGESAVIVIAEPTLDEAIDKAIKNAKREVKREIRADAKELEREVDAMPAA